MKKKILILIIILLIISPSFVYANVVYGEYKEFIMNTDEYMEETDTLKREEVKLYNTYEIKKVDLGYQEECINCDTSDYISETIESDEEIPGGIKYQPVLSTNSRLGCVSFYDFDIDRSVKLYEIEIYSGNKKIDYTFFNSKKDVYKNLNDGDRNTYYMLKYGDSIDILIEGDYLDQNITINIVGPELHSKFLYITSKGPAKVLKNLANNIYFVDESKFNELKNKFGSKDYGFTNGNGETFESLNPFYKKEIKKYHCYGEEKVILDNYVTEGDNLIYDDYITKYNYYIRTKEEIIDDEAKSNNINNLIDKTIEVKKTTTNQVKPKKASNKTTSLVTNNVEKNVSVDEEVLQVSPLFNEFNPKEKKSNIKFVVIVILLIITLQIIIFTLHRKK